MRDAGQKKNHVLGAGGRIVNSVEWSRNQLIGGPVSSRDDYLGKKRKLRLSSNIFLSIT